MVSALLKWLCFGVAISVLPFCLKALFYWLDNSGWVGWLNLWPNGELMLVAVALAAESLGELVLANTRKHSIKSALIGAGCVLTALASVATFGYLSANPGQQQPENIFLVSVVLTLLALIASGFCKGLMHLADTSVTEERAT